MPPKKNTATKKSQNTNTLDKGFLLKVDNTNSIVLQILQKSDFFLVISDDGINLNCSRISDVSPHMLLLIAYMIYANHCKQFHDVNDNIISSSDANTITAKRNELSNVLTSLLKGKDYESYVSRYGEMLIETYFEYTALAMYLWFGILTDASNLDKKEKLQKYLLHNLTLVCFIPDFLKTGCGTLLKPATNNIGSNSFYFVFNTHFTSHYKFKICGPGESLKNLEITSKGPLIKGQRKFMMENLKKSNPNKDEKIKMKIEEKTVTKVPNTKAFKITDYWYNLVKRMIPIDVEIKDFDRSLDALNVIFPSGHAQIPMKREAIVNTCKIIHNVMRTSLPSRTNSNSLVDIEGFCSDVRFSDGAISKLDDFITKQKSLRKKSSKWKKEKQSKEKIIEEIIAELETIDTSPENNNPDIRSNDETGLGQIDSTFQQELSLGQSDSSSTTSPSIDRELTGDSLATRELSGDGSIKSEEFIKTSTPQAVQEKIKNMLHQLEECIAAKNESDESDDDEVDDSIEEVGVISCNNNSGSSFPADVDETVKKIVINKTQKFPRGGKSRNDPSLVKSGERVRSVRKPRTVKSEAVVIDSINDSYIVDDNNVVPTTTNANILSDDYSGKGVERGGGSGSGSGGESGGESGSESGGEDNEIEELDNANTLIAHAAVMSNINSMLQSVPVLSPFSLLQSSSQPPNMSPFSLLQSSSQLPPTSPFSLSQSSSQFPLGSPAYSLSSQISVTQKSEDERVDEVVEIQETMAKATRKAKVQKRKKHFKTLEECQKEYDRIYELYKSQNGK